MSFTIKRAFLPKARKSKISDSDNWARLRLIITEQETTRKCVTVKHFKRAKKLNESKTKSLVFTETDATLMGSEIPKFGTKQGSNYHRTKITRLKVWALAPRQRDESRLYLSANFTIAKLVTISRCSIYATSSNWSLDKITGNWPKRKRDWRLAQQLCESYIVRSNDFMNIHVANCHVVVTILTHYGRIGGSVIHIGCVYAARHLGTMEQKKKVLKKVLEKVLLH